MTLNQILEKISNEEFLKFGKAYALNHPEMVEELEAQVINHDAPPSTKNYLDCDEKLNIITAKSTNI